MTRRVLVTGAAGNIGSVVMRDLTSDFELVGLDVVEARGIASVDVGDYEALLPHLAGIDTVVHLGADPNPSAPWDSAAFALAASFTSTMKEMPSPSAIA